MQRIGVCTIDRELGRGGMHAVYLGRDPRLDRAVATEQGDPRVLCTNMTGYSFVGASRVREGRLQRTS